MKKRKLFSNSDGTSFGQDISDISEEVKAFFNHLPLELKKLLPIAEDIVRAIQTLDDLLEEGHPVNEAIEKVLAMTKTEVDDKLYECIKNAVKFIAEKAAPLIEKGDHIIFEAFAGEYKLIHGSTALAEYSNINQLQADTAIQLAVYAVKS